jgi:hypothetical protein
MGSGPKNPLPFSLKLRKYSIITVSPLEFVLFTLAGECRNFKVTLTTGSCDIVMNVPYMLSNLIALIQEQLPTSPDL